jgi:hypothetical protein
MRVPKVVSQSASRDSGDEQVGATQACPDSAEDLFATNSVA